MEGKSVESFSDQVIKNELFKFLQKCQVVIVSGPKGNDMSEQLPIYLREAGFFKDRRRIGITQTRRQRVIELASKVADDLGVKLGDDVGFAIRHDCNLSGKTIIKYMTDGVLLREILNTPEEVDGYSAIIIDEAQERTLNTDLVLALLKNEMKTRTSLKVIVLTRANAADKFSKFFENAPVIHPGKKDHHVEEEIKPEILKMDPENVALALKAYGMKDLAEIELMDSPTNRVLAFNAEKLIKSGALDKEGKLTPAGRQKAEELGLFLN